MVPPPARTGRRAGSVDDLLHTIRRELPAELADRLRAGAAPAEAADLPRVATGIAAVDALLGGGFPRGRLAEITGAVSSGRTSLAHALLAAATRAGEVAAVVDAADAFDPASAHAAGVELARVLWARAPRPREAMRCAERLLEARGFGVVLIDLGREPEPRLREDAGDAAPIWLRMNRSARASGTALVLLAGRSRLGPFAALTLEAQATRARFAMRPDWLEGLDARLVSLRSRIGGVPGGDAPVAWRFRPG
jgi:hypothetical protein